MEQFTDHYVRNSKPDMDALPYWDLYTALRHDERHMRDGLRYVVDHAFERIQ